VIEELSCVLIAVSDPHVLAMDDEISSDHEVAWAKTHARPISFHDDLTFQERSLWNSAVALLRLDDRNSVVLEVVENLHTSDAEVFRSAFSDVLLKVSFKPQYLSVQLDEGWFVLICNLTGLLWIVHRVGGTLPRGVHHASLIRNVNW
jgi:hypothetical protein